MVENLIAGYLATGKRLVIPELGAFLKKDSGEIVFVEYLKKDDGVFSSHISQSLGVPVSEAARQAAELTAEIRSSLAGRGFFIIPNLGTMRRDASGSINLTPTLSEPNPEPVMPPAQPVQAQATAPAPVPEPPKVVRYEDTAPKQQAKVEQYTPPARVTTPPTENYSAAASTAPPQAPSVAAGQQSRPLQGEAQPAPQPQASPVKPTPRPDMRAMPQREEPPVRHRRPPVNVPQGRKKTDLVMIIAVIAALIAIGAMVFGLMVNNDPIMNLQPTQPQQEVVVDADAIEEAAE